MDIKHRIIAGSSSLAATACAALLDRAQSLSARDYIARQDAVHAAQSRSAARQRTKAAVEVLINTGREQIVLGHIHPRWLRDEVARRFDAGEEISDERVEQLRAMGPV